MAGFNQGKNLGFNAKGFEGMSKVGTPFRQFVDSNCFKQLMAGDYKLRQDAEFIDELFEDAKNATENEDDFDWEESPYPSFKSRRDLNWKVIVKFIAAFESFDPGDMMMTENGPEMSEWYERLVNFPGNICFNLTKFF